jgi:hypothetical protein
MDLTDGKAGLAVVGALMSMLNSGWAQDSKPPLTGEVRTTFVESATNGCLDTRDSNPAAKAMPASTVLQFCRCTANRIADNLSVDEVKRIEAMDAKDGPPAAVRTLTENSAKACIESMQRPRDAAPAQRR